MDIVELCNKLLRDIDSGKLTDLEAKEKLNHITKMLVNNQVPINTIETIEAIEERMEQ